MSVSPGEQNCSQYREAAGLFESYCIDGARIDLTDRFPLIVAALAKLRSRSYIIDGEAVACGDDGIPSFDRIRYRRHDADVFLDAFDLIEPPCRYSRRTHLPSLIALISSSASKF